MKVKRYRLRRFHRWAKAMFGVKEPELIVVPVPTIIGMDHQGRIQIMHQAKDTVYVAKMELHEVLVAMVQVPIADPDKLLDKIMRA